MLYSSHSRKQYIVMKQWKGTYVSVGNAAKAFADTKLYVSLQMKSKPFRVPDNSRSLKFPYI